MNEAAEFQAQITQGACRRAVPLEHVTCLRENLWNDDEAIEVPENVSDPLIVLAVVFLGPSDSPHLAAINVSDQKHQQQIGVDQYFLVAIFRDQVSDIGVHDTPRGGSYMRMAIAFPWAGSTSTRLNFSSTG